MTVPTTLPFPRSNMTAANRMSWASAVTGSDIIVAVGDYTGGAADDLFTLASHGLVDGDRLTLVSQSAIGTVLGGVGTRAFVQVLSSSTFQLASNRALTTIIENTSDGTAVFLKSSAPAHVIDQILPLIIVADGDFTGGTTEDMFVPRPETGYAGLYEADSLKLLYKAAAGVLTGISANTTVYAKSVTLAAFETAASAGGADIENTADGLAVFLKTS